VYTSWGDRESPETTWSANAQVAGIATEYPSHGEVTLVQPDGVEPGFARDGAAGDAGVLSVGLTRDANGPLPAHPATSAMDARPMRTRWPTRWLSIE
jgi:hypothetical protein